MKCLKCTLKNWACKSVSHFTDKFAKAIEERDFWGIGWINNGLNDKAKKSLVKLLVINYQKHKKVHY